MGLTDTTAQFFLNLDLLPKPPCFNDLDSVFSTPLTSQGTPVKLPVTDAMYRLLVQSNSTLESVIESTSDNPAHALAESISVALRRSPACEPTDEITIAGKGQVGGEIAAYDACLVCQYADAIASGTFSPLRWRIHLCAYRYH